MLHRTHRADAIAHHGPFTSCKAEFSLSQGSLLGIDDIFTSTVAAAAVQLSGGCDPDVAKNAERTYAEMEREEQRFRKTLAQGRKVLADVLQVRMHLCNAASDVHPSQTIKSGSA